MTDVPATARIAAEALLLGGITKPAQTSREL
jgi:hypothetical protein